MDAGSQCGAQQPSVGCLVSQRAHSCQSDVDGSGSEAALLQVKPITQNHCFVECQSWIRTVPGNELVNSMLISAPRIRRTEAPEDCGFRVFQIGDAELSLGSVLLALCSIRRRLPHDCRPPRQRFMRLTSREHCVCCYVALEQVIDSRVFRPCGLRLESKDSQGSKVDIASLGYHERELRRMYTDHNQAQISLYFVSSSSRKAGSQSVRAESSADRSLGVRHLREDGLARRQEYCRCG